MSNEITVNASLSVRNAAHIESYEPSAKRVTQAAIGGHGPIIDVGTSEEDFSAGDVTTLGWVFFHNLDTANYVRIGPKSGGAMVPLIRLRAGEFAVLRLEPGITLRAQANTAAVKLKMLLLQD